MTFKLIVLYIVFSALHGIASQGLHYTVDLRHSSAQRVHVTLELEMMGAEVISYQMPAWAPGAYAITNYGRFIENFKAYGYDGKEKPVERLNENRWRILHGKDIRRITYDVANSYKDSSSLYYALAHFDSSFVFANATALFGYVNDKKEIAFDVTYLSPSGWEVETALDSVSVTKLADGSQEARYHAHNYDELADAPVMAGPGFQRRSFRIGKTLYDVVVASDKQFAMDSLAGYTRRIVEAQLDFWRDTPFVRYKFLLFAPAFRSLPRKEQGALEHANSSAYLFTNAPWNYIKREIGHIISHEFFHAWNVKQIHSAKLGPFDYTKPVKTKELWLAEGVTDYYSYMLPVRYKILEASALPSMLDYLYETIDSTPATLSLEELSLAESNFDLDNAIQFYTRGTLCGFLLDVELRSRSNNKTSLDAVMRALNKEAKRGKRYRDDELMTKISRITKIDITEFYRRYIAGASPLPLDEYLRKLGIARRVRMTEKSGVGIAARLDTIAGSFLVIDSLYDHSPFATAGVARGDTLLMIGGKPADPASYNQWRVSHNAPLTESFLFGAARGRIEKTLTLTSPWQSWTKTLGAGVLPETTPSQDEMRHAIFGNEFNFIGWESGSSIRSFETNAPRRRE